MDEADSAAVGATDQQRIFNSHGQRKAPGLAEHSFYVQGEHDERRSTAYS